MPTEGRAEDRILDDERGEKSKKIEAALGEAFSDLDAEDRLILKMRFEDGFSIAQIASVLKLEQRPLYKRIDKVLKRMRKPLEDRGIESGDISELLEWKNFSLGVHYGVDSGKNRS